MTALALALLLGVSSPSSTALVERFIEAGDTFRRVSVFHDGMAVLSIRKEGEEHELHRRRLQPLELRVLSLVVEECYGPLNEQGGGAEAPGGAWQTLRLAPPGHELISLRVPLLAGPSAELIRLGQALDEVENLLTSLPSPAEDLSGWIPEVGDELELLDGRLAKVRTVMKGVEELMFEVELGDGQGTAVYSLSELRRRANRRIGP